MPAFTDSTINAIKARLTMSDSKANTLRVVLAFDMQVEESDPNLPYAALSTQDVNAHAQFRLAWHIRDNAWFIRESWVDEWLQDIWSKRPPIRKIFRFCRHVSTQKTKRSA